MRTKGVLFMGTVSAQNIYNIRKVRVEREENAENAISLS